MKQQARFVGLFLILGAAVGFTLGLVLVDAATAAILGAAGAGAGVVIGAIVDAASHRQDGGSQPR